MKHTTSSMQALAFNFASGLLDAFNKMDTAHAQWKQSDDVSKAAFKCQWQLGYVSGRLSIDPVKAAHILAQKRAERTYEAELAVNAAGKDFSYNIRREGAKAKGQKRAAAQSDTIEVPAGILAAAVQLVKLCAEYKGAAKLLATAVATARLAAK